ncbi:MAG: glycosyltransferase family 2 protein [Chloroflexota bacterium]
MAEESQSSEINHQNNSEKYGTLRDENRVVMRHNIALNIDSFRASSDNFERHAQVEYPALQTTHAPFISVIIPNYNGSRFLPPLFHALEQQTFQDFEVIFVDDASTDSSVALLEEGYSQHVEGNDKSRPEGFDLRLIVNRSNVGFAVSCNQGADVARGSVLVLLNNDTEPDADWLAELVKVICTHPDAAIVTSKMLLFDQRDHLHTTGDMLGRNGIPENRGVWQKDQGQFDGQISVFSGSGGGSAYRRDVWQLLGGFDEDFWMYLEDVDLAFRAQLAGWSVVFAPNARIYHHLSATGGGGLASYYVGRNTIWTIIKNMPRSLLIRNLPQIIQAQFNITFDALRNLRGEAAQARLKGQIAALLGLPKQLQKRQVVQQRRILADQELAKKLT